MKVKPRGKIYSLNEGYAEAWSEGLKSYIAEKKSTAVSTIHTDYEAPLVLSRA